MLHVEADRPAIRMLGPIQVETTRGARPLGGPRARRLLAALAIRANRPVSISFLIDAAWGDQPPATCREQVNNGAGRLRRRLGTVGARLSRIGEAYQLSIDPGRIDVHAFEADLARSRAAVAAGDAAGAVTLGRRALGHWYGDALGGPVDGPLAGEVARLEELRLAAYGELFANEMALGRHDAVVGEAATLMRRHPFHEGVVGQLMTALQATGRSGEALRLFREHRHRMLDELGIEPDAAVRALAWEIMREERTAPEHPIELHVLLAQLAEVTAGVARYLRQQT